MQDLAAYSEQMIRQGSKSFAKAAMLFDANTRESVMMLYAWCRYCDDVIDGQILGHGLQTLAAEEKQARLALLQQETTRVCNGEDSTLPAFAALGTVVRKHGLERRHLFDLLEGFALDAQEVRFITLNDTLHYCYHVAGVVGVMMAQIMGVRERATRLRAADLGIAFQLTNIARDVADDLQVGRCYLPEEWLRSRGLTRDRLTLPAHQSPLQALACELVTLAEQYYASARIGMAHLPWRCAWAIGAALLIYRDIGLQLRAASEAPQAAAAPRRSQVSSGRKFWRLCQGGVLATAAIARRRGFAPHTHQSREGLWTKPDL